MAELADEELTGVVPKKIVTENDSWNDIGYYIDENGHRRWGVIQKRSNNINISTYFGDDGARIRSSNPRHRLGYIP